MKMGKNKDIELVDKIDDKNLKEVLEFAESKKILEFDPQKLLPKEKEDIKEIVIEKFKSFLTDKSDGLRSRISELRKKGFDVEVESFRSIHLPLKIKVFLATYSKIDFKNILEKLDNLEKEIVEIERKIKLRD